MDPITHSLTGGLSSYFLKFDRRRFLIFCFLGEAPDLDVLLNKLGSWAFIFQHRGLSHALLGIVLQAVFFAFLLKRWDLESSYWKRVAVYCIPLSLHVFCDYLTSYGVPLFSPFTQKSYQGDLVTAINLWPMLVMATGFIAIRYGKQSRKVALAGVIAGWALYLSGSWVSKKYVHRQFNFDPYVTVVPTIINPFEWGVVKINDEQSVYEASRINLITRQNKEVVRVPLPSKDPIIQASLQSSLVQTFFKENRWPTARLEKHELGWQVDWGSLLFSTRGFVRGKVRVILNDHGEIVSSNRYFGFWTPEIKHAT